MSHKFSGFVREALNGEPTIEHYEVRDTGRDVIVIPAKAGIHSLFGGRHTPIG
jgi:hypothetical protein